MGLFNWIDIRFFGGGGVGGRDQIVTEATDGKPL